MSLVSCDTNCIIYGITFFIRWGQLKKGVTWLLVKWCCWHQCEHHMTLMALSMTQFYLLNQDDWNKVQHDTDGIINTQRHLLDQDDQNKQHHDFFIYLTLSTGITIMWCQLHFVNSSIVFIRPSQPKTMCMCNITFFSMQCHWCWCQCHMMPRES